TKRSTLDAPAFQPRVPGVLVRSPPIAVAPTTLVQVTGVSDAAFLAPTSSSAASVRQPVRSAGKIHARHLVMSSSGESCCCSWWDHDRLGGDPVLCPPRREREE